MHTWISPVGTTEKTFHEFANSIIPVPLGSMKYARLLVFLLTVRVEKKYNIDDVAELCWLGNFSFREQHGSCQRDAYSIIQGAEVRPDEG